jgi:hypothetical protein
MIRPRVRITNSFLSSSYNHIEETRCRTITLTGSPGFHARKNAIYLSASFQSTLIMCLLAVSGQCGLGIQEEIVNCGMRRPLRAQSMIVGDTCGRCSQVLWSVLPCRFYTSIRYLGIHQLVDSLLFWCVVHILAVVSIEFCHDYRVDRV